ncbi:DUF2272 domain-containing protein [Ralstonia solanacearum]|uniref:DUF2272 domain-containing protein n=1 Tax=Ralstonia solanacearum TaxID=305 RepID=UPI0005C48B58|nr:DUF2272 domain-containing protein [Ralstonia solanacearum]MBB6589744.1 DUF2272 domain-containing protein [Ralstonia solanacearum]MBB6593940.1 DUF2272 domain-containing protein [Ralstonia solanacearum]MDB0542096.1 DUF2272 domain-containing protein [Ralstonia solanacearum]MDB0553153.1 DUF2272 domain-containing protein [Ralstonia solanacearum]MDB0557032.1 DUF2272 domain-containing protein [Ralstonia solanacearum]
MSRPLPRVLRIALPLLLMAPLVWFAGCTTPPARPQAEPLPDHEVVATRPGATARDRMIEIALTEWDRWGRQVVRVGRDDTYCVTEGGFPDQPPGRWLTVGEPAASPGEDDAAGSGGDLPADRPQAGASDTFPSLPATTCLRYPDGSGGEATARGCMLAQRYWRIVGKEPTCQQLTTGAWAWSAVFISWIMRKAGLQNDQFLTGATHAEYVTDARDHLLRQAAFKLERTPAVPRPGDLICSARGADRFMSDPAEIRSGMTPMHCDLVVEVDPLRHEVKSIGGNVQQSASMSITELNDANQLDPYTNSVMQWFVILRNQLP